MKYIFLLAFIFSNLLVAKTYWVTKPIKLPDAAEGQKYIYDMSFIVLMAPLGCK